MKKFVSILLMISIMFSVLASCGDGGSEGAANTDTGKDGNPVTTPDETTEISYIDTLPKKDFGGKKYTIGAPAAYNLVSEELTGETINDAAYYQAAGVQDKFNVIIEVIDVTSSQVTASVNAGDNAYQVITGGTSSFASTYVTSGIVHNLMNFKDIDFTKPWWNQNTVNDLTLNGKMYMAYGDFCAERGITYIHSFFFNKDLARDYGIEASDVYQLVYDGKWTIERLEQYIKGISIDLNGDSKMDFNDLYGLGQSIPVSGVYRTSFDCLIMDKDNEGYPVLNINTDKFNDIVSRVYSLCFENESVRMGAHAEEGKLGDIFVSGQLVFYSGFLCDVEKLRVMESEFGVLPFPKWDDAQDGYFTTARGDNYFLGIPVSVGEDDFEFVGIVTEAFAHYGYSLVRQAVYEDTLKGKMTRDVDSMNMLDILTTGCIIEYAFAHANNSGFSYVLWNLLDTKQSSFASYYERKLKAADKYYEKLNDLYKSMD